MDRWEYLVMDAYELFGFENPREWPTVTMDELGKEGWELITTSRGISKRHDIATIMYYFKRSLLKWGEEGDQRGDRDG